jgi:Sulfotransferase family
MSTKSFDQFVCLAGMPRSGSTVLAAILSQNPQIHTEGNSPMCQMMWDTYLSYQDRCNREFASNGKDTMLLEPTVPVKPPLGNRVHRFTRHPVRNIKPVYQKSYTKYVV